MQLLAHPFRLAGGGRAATLTDGTDAALADAVVRVVLTRPGELELVPAYGVPDPTWGGPTRGGAGAGGGDATASAVDVARVNACLSTFGPAATVALAEVTRDARTGTESVRLEVTP